MRERGSEREREREGGREREREVERERGKERKSCTKKAAWLTTRDSGREVVKERERQTNWQSQSDMKKKGKLPRDRKETDGKPDLADRQRTSCSSSAFAGM